MSKLILFILISGFIMIMYALQLDEELAIHTFFQGKRAVNRAVHAASQQVDPDQLQQGVHAIDPVKAEQEAKVYLENNLQLDTNLNPLPGTFLKAQIRILEFQVIDSGYTFPYTYNNTTYNYTVTLQRPGVVMIIQLAYPRTFSVIGPITWDIKGSDELVY